VYVPAPVSAPSPARCPSPVDAPSSAAPFCTSGMQSVLFYHFLTVS
jgi:nuclear receptor co-repressor 1